MSRFTKIFEAVDKPKSIKSVKKPKPRVVRNFHVINRDARFYRGMRSCDILWTDDPMKAKTFENPMQIKHLKRWKPEENMEIIYKDEL